MVTSDEFIAYVGMSVDEDTANAVRSFNVAQSMINEILLNAFRIVPEDVRDQLVLEVAHGILKRSDAPTGAAQGMEYGTGAAVMGPRDPLAYVMPIIRRYVLPL